MTPQQVGTGMGKWGMKDREEIKKWVIVVTLSERVILRSEQHTGKAAKAGRSGSAAPRRAANGQKRKKEK